MQVHVIQSLKEIGSALIETETKSVEPIIMATPQQLESLLRNSVQTSTLDVHSKYKILKGVMKEVASEHRKAFSREWKSNKLANEPLYREKMKMDKAEAYQVKKSKEDARFIETLNCYLQNP